MMQHDSPEETVEEPIAFLPRIFQRGDVAALAAHLRQEKRRSLRQNIALYSATALEGLLFVWFLFGLFDDIGNLPEAAWANALCAVCALGIALVLTVLMISRQPADALQFNDVRLVGPLA